MKKIIASLAAMALLCASVPTAAFAADDSDLSTIASNSGSNNYVFPNNASKYTISANEPNVSVKLNTSAYAMCALTILANKGIIYPSDIVPGASSISDLAPTDEVKAAMKKYADNITDDRILLELGGQYSSTPQSQLIDEAISCASHNGRYFMIAISQPKLLIQRPYPFVGIGSAKGNWTFNDKNYDLCILTLDPVVGNKFSEDRCIYVNTETYDFCIPNYEFDSSNADFFAVIDDPDLLNYNGPINPSTKIPFDGSDDYQLWEFMFGENTSYDIAIDGIKSGLIKAHGDSENLPTGLAENLYMRRDTIVAAFVEKGAVTLNIDMTADPKDLGDMALAFFQDSQTYDLVAVTGEADIKRDGNSISVTRYTGDLSGLSIDDQYEMSAYMLGREVYDKSYPVPGTIVGATKGTTTVDFTAKGVLFTDTENLEILIRQLDDETDEETTMRFTSKEPVMLKYNELNKEWNIFRDAGDGTFGEAVQKGDVNCDGAVNSADASLVLKTYALMSTGSEAYFVDQKYGDMNGDGAVDAIDASTILKIYADASTGSSN